MIAKPSKPSKADKSSDTNPTRVAVGYRLPAELVDRLAATAWHLAGQHLLLVDIVEHGIERELTRLERRYHRGRAFPPVPEGRRLRGGRRSGRLRLLGAPGSP